jgi:hypothetical protein
MKTIKLTDAQLKWLTFWVSVFECPIKCESGHCTDCRHAQNIEKILRQSK